MERNLRMQSFGKVQEEKTFIHRILGNLDWMLLITVLSLLLIGLVSVYSASLHFGNPGKYFATQLIAIILGAAGLLIFLTFNYQYFRQATYIIYSFSIILLISVLIFGVTVRGTKGWFNLGYFSFQPVEVAKLIYILVLAGYLDKNWRNIKHLWKLFIPLLLLAGHIGLILLQPDFSSTLVYFPITLILLYAVGAEPLYLLGMMLFGSLAIGIPLMATYFRLQPSLLKSYPFINYFVIATTGGLKIIIILFFIILGLFILWWFLNKFRVIIPFIYFVIFSGIIIVGTASSFVVQKSLREYQRKRLIVFINPDIDPLGSGYNIIQSKIAIGSGRFLGKGLFSGTQSQLGFLPEQHTDFIFSVVGEETGYFFSQLTIFLYFLLIWRSMIVARESRDRFGSLVAIGISTMFAFYGVINIGMVMGLMPATGLPLPMLSYGGSSMVSALWSIGILLSIHVRRFTH